MKKYIISFCLFLACKNSEDITDSAFPDLSTSATMGESICGDGIQSENEECDDNLDNINCRNCIKARRIFVDSVFVDGILLANINARCYSIADNSGLVDGFDWIPWLSYSNQNINDLIYKSPFRYELVDGTVIANNFQDLIDGNLQHPINLNYEGILTEGKVWTGTNEIGEFSGLNCENWSNQFRSFGTFGLSTAIDYNWSNSDFELCSEKLHIYCVEDKKL